MSLPKASGPSQSTRIRAAGLDPSLAGHMAAISQDLPFGHPSLLRTDLRDQPPTAGTMILQSHKNPRI
jgi:hypothetical protein